MIINDVEILLGELSPDIKIYRYLKYTKFCELLKNSQVWFSRVDNLNEPHEMALTKEEIEERELRWKGLPEEKEKIDTGSKLDR